MNDDELEVLFNNVISDIAPEAVDIIWSEIKEYADEPLQEIIDEIIANITQSDTLLL